MSEATHAFGTVLRVGDGGSPETFSSIAEITEVTPPQITQDAIEVTHHESPDKFREYIPGIRDGGEVGFTINFIPNDPTHDWIDGVLGKVFNGNVNNWQIELPVPTAVKIAFEGFCTAFNMAAPIDGVLSADCTLRITGKPVFSSL